MNKIKVYQGIIVLFILLNITLVAFCINKRGTKGPNREGTRAKTVIIEKLNFNKEQIAQYEILIDKHRKSMHEKLDQIEVAKSNLYAHLNDQEQDQTLVDSLGENISAMQRELEKLNYQHLLDIKGICTAEQLDDFQRLSQEVTNLFQPRRGRNK